MIGRPYDIRTGTKGGGMKQLLYISAALAALAWASSAAAAGWTTSVPVTNQVASSPTTGGGYPDPDGATAPDPGTCRLGNYNSNHSESWLAVKPGTEDIVGASKIFFEKYSTFYNFHLGVYTMFGGMLAGNVQILGYDCVSIGI